MDIKAAGIFPGQADQYLEYSKADSIILKKK